MIIGIGIDIIEIDRIIKLLTRYENHFIERLFTQHETEYCESKSFPAQHYAARFAAKEAALKALGTGLTQGIIWKDIEVISCAKESPSLRLHGNAQNIFVRLGGDKIHLSISHSKKYAIAQVIFER